MSLKTQRVNDANAIASSIISAELVDKKSQAITQQFAKNVNIHGFRKGKVPLNIVKQRYAKQIQQEVEQEAIRENFQQVLKDLKVEQKDVLGNPAITKFERKGNEIDIEFKISLAPKIDLSKLKSCVPDAKIKDPSLKEIDERLDEIAKSQAPLIEAKATAKLAEGNTANIDFEGFIAGKAFEGGKAQGFDLVIGSNQFIAGFEPQLIGMKKGEEKDIQVTFPENYQAKELAGKEATFKIKLNMIKIKDEAKLDDEVAKKILNNADATLQTLKDQVKLQLQNEMRVKLYNEELKPKLVDNILESIKFDLPDLIVEQEINILLNNYVKTLTQEEFEKFQADNKAIEAKRKELEDEAKKSVTITFIVDSASKEYGVQVQDNEVIQALYYEAMMAGQNPKATLEFYQKQNLLPAVKMAMLEDRILTMLLDEKINMASASKASSKEDKPKEIKGEKPKKTSTKKSTTKKEEK
ncbi:trigger factor [Helicobacter cholecystus]|uniref:Trigger factor n=1 Tax=Helicobacter cholecystus TaxID=45498 RepID=A0A3D8IXZ0_9HELI|nr:trigger factor [Helicobacter cholecystus]RDU69923.1 trigger factor [Helicobacter cholecystus]VEJ25013.1 trigger factor [Helicobacter cholecystus]